MYEVELHAEVAQWLAGLGEQHFARVDALVGRLAEAPHRARSGARLLEGPLWELKFRLSGTAWRLTYWISGSRIIFLTVIRKTQDRQQLDIERAARRQVECKSGHGPARREFRRST